ncbi:probable prolyl 4-hydroxylase 12 isoform X2 [Sesamum indicum]|uniref:procollagen-proline 4-dioxygenase n=1 Tax=Sesamum indicum TaxID=4182 RepID=A0A8M8V3H2_SESIN|nr:probable prolyl 4-hydroxylase 12 isoform X2 [Sesamum indicum]
MATKVRVFLYRNFLSDEECDYLISWVHRKKSHNMQVDDLPQSYLMDTDDEIARNIEDRISAWTFLPKENSKSLQVLHFGPEDSKQKYSYFHNKAAEEVGEPLLATVILYLSNVSQGGQILFPHSENRVWSDCTKSSKILRPSRGNAIVFFSLHLNATPDKSSFHARCPVLEGDMWCTTKFFYLKSINAEKVRSDSDNADCTDEDDNCPRWASIGECQRNPIFMVGSPDYYGTCRKSCNACSL